MTDLFEAEATTTTSLDLRRLQRQKRRAVRRKWALITTSLALVIFAIGASIAWNFLQSFQIEDTTVADYEGAGQGAVQVVVEPGDTGADIAQTLYDAGVIASTEAFIIEANQHPDSARIVPGHYFMLREMKAEFALLALLDPANRDIQTLTIPEGKYVEAYFQSIANITDSTVEEVEAAAADTDALGLPEEANGNLEGWLFPSTYQFNPGTHPQEMLSEMVALTIKTLDDRGVEPEDRQRVLTIASLIEREARLDEDRPLVSGVIHNRLEQDMRLEFDSTVKYLTRTDGVYTSDDERAIDSPYNTYQVTGLPPAPIAGAGVASIEAAIEPTDHDYLFFVTVDLVTGETMYAETYNEHLANVEVLREWERSRADD